MIYNKIEALCRERNVSIRKVENECHLSNGCIAKWKTARPAAESLYRVAKFLGVNIEYFFEE